MAERFENLRIGEKMEINSVDFQVVGYFTASGSAAESEVWTDLRDITTARRTPGAVSSVNLRAADDSSKRTLIDRIAKDEQFNLKVVDEIEYYEEQASTSRVLWWVAMFIAFFIGVAAMLAAATTMYAAVASRAREIGTLRALGFSRVSILTSFLLESVLLCLMGGIVGCLATLPLNGLSTGTANFATFSEITFAFQFGPLVLGLGMLMSLIMGVLGGFFPALRAVSLNIVTALRAQ
jgi:putative ABC transport system permease protein